jgi:hypothetical protein
VETWGAPATEDLLAFEDETLSCHDGQIPVGHDDLEFRLLTGVLAFLGSCDVDCLRLQLVEEAVVHKEATDVAGL